MQKPFINVKTTDFISFIEKEHERISTFVKNNKKKYIELYAKLMDSRLKKSWYMRIFHKDKLDNINHTIEQATTEINKIDETAYLPILKDEKGNEIIWEQSEAYLREVTYMKNVLSNSIKNNLDGTISVPFGNCLYTALSGGISNV